jgi:hypothetical protein
MQDSLHIVGAQSIFSFIRKAIFMDLSERIDRALIHAEQGAGLTKKAVRGELERAGISCSHPTLESYRRGDTEPRPRFLLELSEICGVRPEWLLVGSGAPTSEEEIKRQKTLPGGWGLPKNMLEILSEHFPIYDRLHKSESGMVWEVVVTYWRWLNWKKKVGSIRKKQRFLAAERVAEAINAPLDELRIRDVPPERMALYVTSVCAALLGLFPEEVRRDTYLEVEEIP